MSLRTGRPKWAYTLIWHYVRWFYLKLYCRTFEVRHADRIPMEGAVLYLATHQNNLPDGLSILFAAPVPPVFVARADYYNHPVADRLLRFLRIMPMQRADHGRRAITEDLPHTQKALRAHLESGGHVAIMPEGSSAPHRDLRPLKKGWARLVVDCETNNIPVSVVPVVIEFTEWNRWGPDVRVTFREALRFKTETTETGPQQLNRMNQQVAEIMQPMISSDAAISAWGRGITQKRKTTDKRLTWLGGLILLPVLLLLSPVLLLARNRVQRHSRRDFQSTLEIGFITLGVPIWLLILTLCTGFLTGWWIVLIALVLLPLILWVAARSYIAITAPKNNF